jgi:hypothetical protein
LDHTSLRSRAAAAIAFFCILVCADCSVPLAPGYRIVNQTREAAFVSGESEEVRIESKYTLQNSGTTDLSFLDVAFPAAKPYGREGLRVEVNGKQVAPAELPEEYRFSQPNTLRIPFESSWKRGETRELAIEYAFRSPVNDGFAITIGGEDFHLSSRGWQPLPQPPRHALAPFPRRPDRVSYTVRVPSNFLVLARGTLAGRKPEGNETAYRFALQKDDLTAFVVAGHYVASSPESKNETRAIFWTFQPLKENPAAAVERISSAWGVLEKSFGQLDSHILAPHIVESANLADHVTGESGAAAVPFPGGALVNAEALALGINSDDFTERTAHALAHNWFGDEVFFAPDAAVGMGEGLPEYATVVMEEALRGEPGRRERATRYLTLYDRVAKEAKESPLGVTMMTDPLAQRRIAVAKAPLFFVALEDLCGEEPMRRGLRQMVTLLRGQETSYDALRATLEETCGKNLAQPFRVWLNDPGIPSDFRARYSR